MSRSPVISHSISDLLSTNPLAMDRRLRSRLTPWEILALALAVGMCGVFAWAHIQSGVGPFDYEVYVKTAHGDLLQYYYADWILPPFWLLAKLPPTWGYLLWNLVNIACVFLAARVFGGNAVLSLVSYQMLYVLFLGQITGILVGGLALLWWALAHKHWHVAGLGLLIASTKFQIGLTFGVLLWLLADLSWRQRLHTLLVPGAVVVGSLLISPSWPMDLFTRISAVAPVDWASISLWRWLGPAALLLWLPPLLLPMARPARFLALMAACPLALPYFQQADLLALFVLPIGWLPVVLGNLGYLFVFFQYEVLALLWIVPLVIYGAIVVPAAMGMIRDYRSRHGVKRRT